ncbi:hypothetical protein [Sphaerisporangium perillae]|uniref:hypothetical protein n=1 Tax=Sphaerisporangium perillae TaxID=2935860 RepID=UPI00200BE79A|nr:hypothetical protein [Sphaerisporangium perillae]
MPAAPRATAFLAVPFASLSLAGAMIQPADPEPQRLSVAPGVALCLDVDVVVSLRVGITIGGPPICRHPAYPPKPVPVPTPSPPPTPTAPPSPSPTVSRPASPAPPVAQGPARPQAAPRTAPPPARPTPPPVEHRPTPPAVTPSAGVHALRADVPPPRRRNPLATVMVLVVLSLVVALVAGLAFGTIR